MDGWIWFDSQGPDTIRFSIHFDFSFTVSFNSLKISQSTNRSLLRGVLPPAPTPTKKISVIIEEIVSAFKRLCRKILRDLILVQINLLSFSFFILLTYKNNHECLIFTSQCLPLPQVIFVICAHPSPFLFNEIVTINLAYMCAHDWYLPFLGGPKDNILKKKTSMFGLNNPWEVSNTVCFVRRGSPQQLSLQWQRQASVGGEEMARLGGGSQGWLVRRDGV